MAMTKAETQTLDAVYEQGVFRVIHPENVDLSEGQKVRIIVERRLTPKEITELAASVYDGLPEEEIREIERIALDRSNFFGGRTP